MIMLKCINIMTVETQVEDASGGVCICHGQGNVCMHHSAAHQEVACIARYSLLWGPVAGQPGVATAADVSCIGGSGTAAEHGSAY